MSVLKKIEDDMKTAMKSRDALRLEVLRGIKTAIKNKEIKMVELEEVPELRPLTEAEFHALLASLVKQRRDSVEQYTKAGRADLAGKEQAEIDVINEYLPKALTADELAKLVAAAIQKCGATGPQDMGKVMKELKEPTMGRVDGKLLADQVKAALQK